MHGVLQPLEHCEAVHHRHVQVEDDGIRRVALRDRQSLLAVKSHDRQEARLAQPQPDRPSDLPVVIDDQDSRLRTLLSFCPGCVHRARHASGAGSATPRIASARPSGRLASVQSPIGRKRISGSLPFRAVATDLGVGAEDPFGDLGKLGLIAGGADEPVAGLQAEQQIVGAELPMQRALDLGKRRAVCAAEGRRKRDRDLLEAVPRGAQKIEMQRDDQVDVEQRQSEPEGAALLRLALHCQRAEIDPHQLARDVQAEPETVFLSALSFGNCWKRSKMSLTCSGAMPGPLSVTPMVTLRFFGVIARPDLDLAVLAGILAGVGAEIDDHPADAFHVCEDIRKAVGDGELDLRRCAPRRAARASNGRAR